MKDSLSLVRDLSKGLCVNAPAGSGKTSLLVERYLAILKQSKSDPGRIVAITFTEKAAAEMKSRIRDAIEIGATRRNSINGVGKSNYGVWPQLANARISTIHSFCTRLLRQYPVEARLDPKFRVLDAVQAEMILKRSIKDHWKEMMERQDKRVLECMDHFKPSKLMEILEELLEQRANLEAYRQKWDTLNKQSLLEVLEKEKKVNPKDKDLQKLQWSRADEKGLHFASILMDLAQEFSQNFDAVKAKTNHLDFEDLQIRALGLLEIPRIREKIQRDIDFLLLDEFQDTNEIQRRITDHLASLRSVFVVGDPKQSIYRFRGSDVSVFRGVQEDMPRFGEVLQLDINYRSVPGILQFCNGFFQKLMVASDRPYEIPHQELKPHRKSHCEEQSDEAIPLRTLPAVSVWRHKLKQDEKCSLDTLRQREANHIAESLVSWKTSATPDKEFRWSDVAILFRSTSKVYLYERELEKRGIPFQTSSTSAFYGQQSVTDVLNTLLVCTNPTDDLAMAGFLRSPIIAIDDETLYRLRTEPSLWESLAHTKDPVLVGARDRIHRWHVQASLLSPAELLRTILEESDYEALLRAQHLGARKVALVRKMLELAGKFRAEEGFTLQDFLEYMRQLVLEEKKEAEGPPLEDADAVSLLTIHKAKGLEFPTVILADLARKQQTTHPEALIHENLGLALKIRDDQEEELPTVQRVLAKLEEKRKDEAESKRVLYVACTRAKDHLIFSGIKPVMSKTKGWNEWILDALETTTGKKLDTATWIEPSKKTSVIASREATKQSRISTEDWELAIRDFTTADTLPARLSVSEVQEQCSEKKKEGFKQTLKPPMQESSLSPTQLGTIAHEILAQWRTYDEKELSALTKLSLRETLLEPRSVEKTSEDLEKMLRGFAASSDIKELRSAKQIHREIPFVLPVQDSQIEGTIDLLYQAKDGTWVILDYKTDTIGKEHVREHRDSHKMQMELYAAACMQIFKLSNIRLELFYLRPGVVDRWSFSEEEAKKLLADLPDLIKHREKELAI